MIDELAILHDLVQKREIRTVFQPIVDVTNASVVGYEALSRGPKGSPLERPDILFEAALRHDMLWEVEVLCRTLAIERAHKLGLSLFLFLNVDPRVIKDAKFYAGFTARFIESLNIDPCRIIFELTEKTAIEDYKAFKQALSHYTRQGYKIAIDDTGAGYSGMRMITETQPHFIKLDMGLVRDIDKDSFKQAVCRNLVMLSKATNMHLIAEGVETIDELNSLISIGVTYVQGYLLGRPVEDLADLNSGIREHLTAINLQKKGVIHSARSSPVSRITRLDKPVSPQMLGHEAVSLLEKTSASGLVVVTGTTPVGLIMRDKCNAKLASPFGYSLHLNRSVELLMDRNPLIVDHETPITEVSQLAMARREENLYDYIIVTKRGAYNGIVTVKRLLEETTAIELNYARHLNPLTGLPGNLLIEQRLQQAMTGDDELAILYVDIDNFKAFNDKYGFESGDQVIQLTAELILTELAKNFGGMAFLGHIGGDDFVAVTPSDADKLREFSRSFLQSFDLSVAGLYDLDHWQQGHYRASPAKLVNGLCSSSPLSISIAGFCGHLGCFRSVADLAETAAQVKKLCKSVRGSCYRIEGLEEGPVFCIQGLNKGITMG